MKKRQDKYTIDDLPRFSPWPARLLGLEHFESKTKTSGEVMREFESEKWGPILTRTRESQEVTTVEDVDRWLHEDKPSALCSVEDQFELLSAREARRRYMELIEKALESYMPASQLVELGAGYGSVILGLAKKEKFSNTALAAGEYSESGTALVELLARNQGTAIDVGHCDFKSSHVMDFGIEENAIIFTSYATHYVPQLTGQFIQALSRCRPKVVVHFEPCYEHCDDISLIAMMRRRYIEVNDYNKNLVDLLHQEQEAGLVRMVEEKRTVFGSNPLLPASILAWEPV